MIVKAKEMCVIDGVRHRPGAVFKLRDGLKVSAAMEVVDAEGAAEVAVQEAPEPYADMTNADIRNRLAEAGIKTAPQLKREKLVALLADLEGNGSNA